MNLNELNLLLSSGAIKVSFEEMHQGQKDAFRLILESNGQKCFMPIDRYIIEFAMSLPKGENPQIA